MRKQVIIHLPNKSMLKFWNSKIAEYRYCFGDDIVFNALWSYWNIKEDQRELDEKTLKGAFCQNEEDQTKLIL